MVRTIVFALLGMGGISGARAAEPLRTVEHVDLQRYVGSWYEVARLPNRFERKCVRDVTAEYTPEKGGLGVRNSCLEADGKRNVAKGRAVVVDRASNAKLKVTFFWPFYGKYWVIGLDPEYRWAVVGEPSRKYLWVLARRPVLSPQERGAVDRVIAERGYAGSALHWNPAP